MPHHRIICSGLQPFQSAVLIPRPYHYYRVLQSDLGKKILNSSEAKVLLVLRTMTAVREVFIPITDYKT